MVVAFAVFLSCIRSYSVASDRVASRVSKHVYAGREFYVKRDDENSLSGPTLSSVSGNKSRKLLHLSKMKRFPDILASYGGSQSNSMLAIAKVAASSSTHNDFFYFMKPLPKFLKNCPTGNLKAALDLGMQVVEVSAEVYESLEKIPKNRRDIPTSVLDSLRKGILNTDLDANKIVSLSKTYWLPQGAAMPEAELGVEQLVDELLQFIILHDSLSTSPNRPWKVVLACGTGTMALFAARHFALKVAVKKNEEDIFHGITRPSSEMIRDSTVQPIYAEVRNLDLKSNCIPDIEVVAVPCVGDSQYLLDQMRTLDLDSGCLKIFPTILKTETERKVISEALLINASSVTSTAAVADVAAASDSTDIEKADNRIFGKPYKEHYQIWCDLKANMDIEFDLIYTPRTFELLLQSFDNDVELWKNSNILYYHCGGVEGNESQIGRYRFQKLI